MRPMYSEGIFPRPNVGAVGSIAGDSPRDRGLLYVSSGEVRVEDVVFFMSRSAVLTKGGFDCISKVVAWWPRWYFSNSALELLRMISGRASRLTNSWCFGETFDRK